MTWFCEVCIFQYYIYQISSPNNFENLSKYIKNIRRYFTINVSITKFMFSYFLVWLESLVTYYIFFCSLVSWFTKNGFSESKHLGFKIPFFQILLEILIESIVSVNILPRSLTFWRRKLSKVRSEVWVCFIKSITY